MIQLLLHGLKVSYHQVHRLELILVQMDPIVSLHFYAPVCAVINACLVPFTEGLEPIYALHRVGILVLLTNAGIAFALNVSLSVLKRTKLICLGQVAAVFLISVGSGLILTLAGVLKDIVSCQ